MKLYIKYMVSLRCKMVVKDALEKLDLNYSTVDLGVVVLQQDITEKRRDQLKTALLKSGLELMDDKRSILIERIKNVVVEMVHYQEEVPKVNFSDHLSAKLHYDYTYLANVFSEVMGTTIQQFIITHKIERAKELLVYDELTLTEIAHRLNYSSVAHLSNQFKKITGLTPSHFKKLRKKRRSMLENM